MKKIIEKYKSSPFKAKASLWMWLFTSAAIIVFLIVVSEFSKPTFMQIDVIAAMGLVVFISILVSVFGTIFVYRKPGSR